MADVVMSDNQNFDATVTSVVDEVGTPVVGATITWSADPGGFLILTPSGNTCNYKSNGLLTAPAPDGVVTIKAHADVPGVGSGDGTLTVQVVNSPVFTVTLSHSTPVNN